MAKTNIPTMVITLILFFIIGLNYETAGNVGDVQVISNVISSTFVITPWLFVVPLLVIIMIVKRVPALPALLAGALLGGVFALIFQPDISARVVGEEGSFSYVGFKGVMMALFGKISVVTENALVNELLATRGMAGMLNTIWLIVCAMVFGGIMEESGMLKVLAEAIIRKVHKVGSLIAATAATCMFFNITTSDQYLAILVPGRMYADVYKKRGLKPENLSRTLEDSATVTSVLVPWNTCGATQASVLGVATLTYAPYCFFNIISPIMTILYGYLNIGITYYAPDEELV
jgi:NhaC family Na+:H+ antiporter